MNTLISSNQIKSQNKLLTLYLLILVQLQKTLLLMITDLTDMNKIVKNNNVYSLIMKTIMRTIIIAYTLETQNENNNEAMVHHINENISEYTTPESTTPAQDASQAGTSTNNHLVRVPTRVVSPRQNTYDPQSYSDTSPRRNITFNFSSNSDDEIQDKTQNITSFRNTSVNVSSPTRTVLDNTQNINTAQNTTRSMYDPPSLPSIFKNPKKTIRSENNNFQQTSSRYYDPFNYSF